MRNMIQRISMICVFALLPIIGFAQNKKDVAEIENIIKALTGGVSNVTEESSFSDLYELVNSNARMSIVMKYPNGGTNVISAHPLVVVYEYRDVFIETKMTETPLKIVVESFGDFATAIASTEISSLVGEEVEKRRSLYSFQFYKVEDQWTILNILKQDESKGFKIPKQYLP